MPIRTGDGEVPGFFPTDYVPDARGRSPEQMAKLIVERLEGWREYKSPALAQKGRVLLAPAIASLAPVVRNVEQWLQGESIAAVYLSPATAEEVWPEAIQRALDDVDVVVDWYQTSDDPLDAPFLKLAERVRAAALARTPPKLLLRWIPLHSSPSEADCKDGASRRYDLEGFKKELRAAVLGARATPPPASGAVATAGSRLVVAAAGADEAELNEILAALERQRRSRDAHVDDAHQEPEYAQTPKWDEEVKQGLERKGVKALIFIDGKCRADWIDRRLRAYDVYREELPGEIRLLVWNKPQPGKTIRRFFPEEYGIKVNSESVDDILRELPA